MGIKYAFLIDDDPTRVSGPAQSAAGGWCAWAVAALRPRASFEWHDQLWRGSPKTGAVLYEMHIGTFSEAGTFDGAIEHLDYLAELGITHIELMPVAEFAGAAGLGI